MRFPTTVREAIHRPIVMLHVASSSGRFVNEDALVDTGADVSLFPNSMASKLGIALPMTSGLPIGSPIGSTTTYRLAEVQLEIRRPPDVLRWRTSIGFVDRPLPYAILGTRGFFEFFRLSYDASQHTFEIEPVDPLPQ